MPTTTRLSEKALELFRLHIRREGDVDVDDANRDAYRELESAGLVLKGRPFVGAARYHLTAEGFARKSELLG